MLKFNARIENIAGNVGFLLAGALLVLAGVAAFKAPDMPQNLLRGWASPWMVYVMLVVVVYNRKSVPSERAFREAALVFPVVWLAFEVLAYFAAPPTAFFYPQIKDSLFWVAGASMTFLGALSLFLLSYAEVEDAEQEGC